VTGSLRLGLVGRESAEQRGYQGTANDLDNRWMPGRGAVPSRSLRRPVLYLTGSG
jgi:hypothetical protein